MAYEQIVRLTRAESTLGYPAILHEMMVYLGFSWQPEFRVREIPRAFGMSRFRALACIPADSWYDDALHFCTADASTVEMAIQRAAYVLITVLREFYPCLNTSPYRYFPRGSYCRDTRVHTTWFDQQSASHQPPLLFRTAQLLQYQDRVTQALFTELDVVREQLYLAHEHLAAYTTLQPTHRTFPHPVVLPDDCAMPDVGGYVPDRGTCLTTDPRPYDPILYGIQGPDSVFDAGVRLRYDPSSGRRRYSLYW